MGTIAQKGDYLENTKLLLKQKINNLGGDITDQTTFRQYADKLQAIYDNAPKTEYAEGSNITLENTVKGKIDFENNIVGYGDTEQTQYSGIQMIDTNETIAETTKSGVTYSLKNGVFTFNGTATGNISIYLTNKVTLKSGSYTFGAKDISGSYTGIFGKYPNAVGTGNVFDGGHVRSCVNATIDSDYSNVRLYLYIANGAVFTNYSFKLLLIQGTYTESNLPNYEPYVGGTASPNPTYPQEIEIVRGKNLFDGEIELGDFDGNGLNSAGNTRLRSKKYTEVLPNTQYTLSWSTTKNARVIIIEYTKNDYTTPQIQRGTSWANSPLTFTTSNTTKYIRLYIISTADSSTSLEDISEIQLEKGSQATSYLPYNTQEVTIRGINLLPNNVTSQTINGITVTKNDDGTIKLNGTSTTQTEIDIGNVSLKAGNYIGQCSSSANTTTYYIRLGNAPTSSSGWVGNLINNTSITLSADTNVYAMLIIRSGVTINNVTIYPQIEKGTTQHTFEPYITPITKQLSLGDIELAEIGTYRDDIWTDRTTKKWYKHSEIIKRILDGTEYINTEQTYMETGRFNITEFNDMKYGSQTNPNVISNCYRSNFSTDDNSIFISGNQNWICIMDKRFINNLNGFKQWLSDNNPYIYYVLKTPTDTEITDTTLIEQLEDIYNIMSLNGTTIIEIDGDLPLVLKVRALKGE